MSRRGDRGGAQTRARIADVATKMFLERGFDEVTIAEVAAAAGVSKMTVFAHFDRKEDLLLDRLPDAVEIMRSAVRDRPPDVGAVEALRRTSIALATRRHPLSGLSDGEDPFIRTFLDSPALIARLHVFEREIEAELASELHTDHGFSGDATLGAALVVAAYRTVAVESIRRRLAGDDLSDIAAGHERRLEKAFNALAHGLPT